MVKGELIFSLLIFLGSVVLYGVTGSIEGRTVLAGAKMGPAFWPQFILGALILLSGIVAVETIRRIVKEKVWGEGFGTLDKGTLRFLAAIGLSVGYLALLPVAGFIVLTPLFLAAFMVLLGEKSKGWIIGVSLAMTAVIVLLFTKAMYVPLPRGEWLFREFSLLFY